MVGAVVRPQWSRCGSYCSWQVCLLWFVCEGPRQTPKGTWLLNPAPRVWAWSPATTPRVDSLLWKNSLVSMEPLCLLVMRPPVWPPLEGHKPSLTRSCFTIALTDELNKLLFFFFFFSFFPVLSHTIHCLVPRILNESLTDWQILFLYIFHLVHVRGLGCSDT